MYEWAAAMARRLDALFPETADWVLLFLQSPLIAMIPAVLALRSASRWRKIPSVQDRIEWLTFRIVASSSGLALASGIFLVFLGWFTILLYIRIVYHLEIDRGYIPGSSARGGAALFFTFGPPAGAGVAVWGLITLWRARRHVRGLQQA